MFNIDEDLEKVLWEMQDQLIEQIILNDKLEMQIMELQKENTRLERLNRRSQRRWKEEQEND